MILINPQSFSTKRQTCQRKCCYKCKNKSNLHNQSFENINSQNSTTSPSPHLTITIPCGVATLTASNDLSLIYWSVNPKGIASPYYFSGVIDVYLNNGKGKMTGIGGLDGFSNSGTLTGYAETNGYRIHGIAYFDGKAINAFGQTCSISGALPF